MWDPHLHMWHVRHRVYDPGAGGGGPGDAVGRWLQRDPIGLAGGLNLYQYCGNEPTGFVDPMGLYFEETATELATNGTVVGEWLGTGLAYVGGFLEGAVDAAPGAAVGLGEAVIGIAEGTLTFVVGAAEAIHEDRLVEFLVESAEGFVQGLQQSGQGIIEGAVGYDLETGEPLSDFERARRATRGTFEVGTAVALRGGGKGVRGITPKRVGASATGAGGAGIGIGKWKTKIVREFDGKREAYAWERSRVERGRRIIRPSRWNDVHPAIPSRVFPGNPLRAPH